jgi:hypothetical protein
MSELRVQLQFFLNELAADELVADLLKLATERRRDLVVPIVRRVETCEAILLAQVWDLTYFLQQLGTRQGEGTIGCVGECRVCSRIERTWRPPVPELSSTSAGWTSELICKLRNALELACIANCRKLLLRNIL